MCSFYFTVRVKLKLKVISVASVTLGVSMQLLLYLNFFRDNTALHCSALPILTQEEI